MVNCIRKNSWKTVIVTIMVLMITVLAGCGGAAKSDSKTDGKPAVKADTGNSLAAIKQRGKLIVGTATGYYPFEMVDKDGKLVGFDIDIATAFAKDLGVEIEFQNYSFAEVGS